MKRNKVSLAVTLALVTVISGCASTPKTDLSEGEVQSQQLSAIANIEDQRETISPQLEDEDLQWFATEQFAIAQAAWDRADQQYRIVARSPSRINERMSMFNATTRVETINEALAESLEALNKANMIRSEARITLAEAFDNRTVLDALEAEELFGQDYREAETMLKSLVDAIAQGRNEDALNGLPGLLRTQHQVEVKTVRAVRLTEYKGMLENLHTELTHEVAPQTFASAQAAHDRAYAFIGQEPRNETRIDELVDATRFAIEHTRHISRDVRFLQAHEAEDYERYLLNIESQLNGIREVLEIDDLRDRSIADQAVALQGYLQEQKENDAPELIALREELSEVQEELITTLESLTAKSEKLESKQTKLDELESLVALMQNEREEIIAVNAELEEELAASEVEDDETLEDIIEEELVIDEENVEPLEDATKEELVVTEMDEAESIQEQEELKTSTPEDVDSEDAEPKAENIAEAAEESQKEISAS